MDHVPMQQLYAPEVRKTHSPNLLTIPVHDKCNKSYQRDEDYFVTALMPHSRGSYAGDAIYKRALERYRGGEKVGLVRRVLADFDPRPSGLVLPGNQVLQRLDGNRIKRVAWKIVRGLYFHHQNKFLLEDLVTAVTLTSPDQEPPEHFKAFMALPDNEETRAISWGLRLPVSERHGSAGRGALLGNVVLGSDNHNRSFP
jgi:hypothetical protein